MTPGEYQLASKMPTQRTALVRGAVVMAFALVAGAFLMQRPETPSSVSWISLAVGLPIVGLALYIGARRNRSTWRSFRLTVAADSLTRRVQGLPDLVVRRAEIIKITLTEGQGLIVHTGDRFKQIYISDRLEGFTEVQDTLATWMPIEQQAKRYANQPLVVGASIATLLLMVVSSRAEDPRILLPANTLLALWLSVCIYLMWRSPHVARWQKWAMLLLVPTVIGLVVRVLTAIA